MSQGVIFHSCSTNPSVADTTSPRSHSLGGRARYGSQSSDVQSVALFTALSWKKLGESERRWPFEECGSNTGSLLSYIILVPGHASQSS